MSGTPGTNTEGTAQATGEGSAPPTAAGGAATAASDAATLAAKLAEIESKLADKDTFIRGLLEENKKYRKRNDEETQAAMAAKQEAEKKLLESGNFAELFQVEKAKRQEAEQALMSLKPKADSYAQLEQKRLAALEVAKTDSSIPAYMQDAIATVARVDVIAAYDTLEQYRASARSAVASGVPTKVAAQPAPALGAAAPTPAAPVNLDSMTPVQIAQFQATNPVEYAKQTGMSGAPNGSHFNPAAWLESKLAGQRG